MRLQNYITEYNDKKITDDWEKVIKILKKECSQYLKESKGEWFLRGIDSRVIGTNELGYAEIRKNRKSKGTPDKSFKKFNKWLQKNGHVRRDQAISATSDDTHIFLGAGNTSTVIFPVNGYKYTFVKAKDINGDYDYNDWYSTIVEDYFGHDSLFGFGLGPEHLRWKRDDMMANGVDPRQVNNDYNKEVRRWLDKEFPKFFISNKKMGMAWGNQWEIWFSGKGYYYVEYWRELHKYLEKNL